MRLPDFILANVEPILAEWGAFGRSIWPAPLNDPGNDPATLRDHAEELLRTTAEDMVSAQTAVQQSGKSQGKGRGGAASAAVDRASEKHGTDRVGSGFEMWGVVAEYRALRASVLRLWRESGPEPDLRDVDDLTRFNESIDQSLTEAVRSYLERVQQDREALLRKEQAARRDAESANRAKDIFLATFSHELRTPLNAIVGWISILRAGASSEAHLTEGLDVIERSTKAQVQLIDDVLDVSRIVSGKLHLEIGQCDLIETINAGIHAVHPAAEARDITLDVQLDPAARRASCDATRMQQVVWNLLSNAIKFTPKGGAIRVALEREQSNLRISVSDNGRGTLAALVDAAEKEAHFAAHLPCSRSMTIMGVAAFTRPYERLPYGAHLAATHTTHSPRRGPPGRSRATFDSTDVVQVLALGHYEDDDVLNSTWLTGDWNGDSDFTSGDLVVALADGGYEAGAAAVPEPAGVMLLAAAALLVARNRPRPKTRRT